MKNKKIIIDTNVWISFFLKDPLAVYDLVTNHHLVVFACEQLRDELNEVMRRKKFKKYFSETDIENALIIFDELTNFVVLKEDYFGSPDPKDNFLFALAKQTKAKILITGDRKLQSFETDFVKTISLTAFKRDNLTP
ncbi:putative toxin-antitoxin system toxin component, PIN family [Capnocytophaga canis]|uniref:putative toxin-antitoxin system toxin component, PIN family n=1 Tax=Capnocytophaga canis TaxID=1848903 RepID=UPI0037CF315C